MRHDVSATLNDLHREDLKSNDSFILTRESLVLCCIQKGFGNKICCGQGSSFHIPWNCSVCHCKKKKKNMIPVAMSEPTSEQYIIVFVLCSTGPEQVLTVCVSNMYSVSAL